MRKIIFVPALIISLAMLIGCNTEQRKERMFVNKKTFKTESGVRRERKVTRDMYIHDLQNQMNDMNVFVSEVMYFYNNQSDTMKTDYQPLVDHIKKYQQNLNQQLQELKNRGDQSWQNMQGPIRENMQAMRKNYNTLRTRLGLESPALTYNWTRENETIAH